MLAPPIERFLAFRRRLPRTPPLCTQTPRARGLRPAVFTSLPVDGSGAIAALGTAQGPAGTRRLVLVDAVGATSAWMPELRAVALERSSPEDREVLERLDDAALSVPDPAVHVAQAHAVYRAWFGNRELADFFHPPPSVSLTGAAVAADSECPFNPRARLPWDGRRSPRRGGRGARQADPTGAAHSHPRVRPHALLGSAGGVLPRRRVVPRRPNLGSARSVTL